MSIDRQFASNFESSTMRKKRFRRVSDMFKLRKALTKTERNKRKRNFDFEIRSGMGKRKNAKKMEKIESKKDPH